MSDEETSDRASIVPVHALAALVALLRLDGEGSDRAGFETAQRDRLAGFLAIAVGAVLDALQRRVDLGDQLALAVARAQLDRPVGLRGGAIGEIGMVLVLVLQVLERLARLPQDLVAPDEQPLAEIIPLALVHERLSIGRPVVFLFLPGHAPRLRALVMGWKVSLAARLYRGSRRQTTGFIC